MSGGYASDEEGIHHSYMTFPSYLGPRSRTKSEERRFMETVGRHFCDVCGHVLKGGPCQREHHPWDAEFTKRMNNIPPYFAHRRGEDDCCLLCQQPVVIYNQTGVCHGCLYEQRNDHANFRKAHGLDEK